jgi:hypothetical protein
MDELSEEDKLTVERARKIQRFMSQPFAVAQVFTGIEGRLVSLKDTIQAFKEILNGEHDALPENAFYSESFAGSTRCLVQFSDPFPCLQWSVVSMTSRPRPLSSPRSWVHKRRKVIFSGPLRGKGRSSGVSRRSLNRGIVMYRMCRLFVYEGTGVIICAI